MQFIVNMCKVRENCKLNLCNFLHTKMTHHISQSFYSVSRIFLCFLSFKPLSNLPYFILQFCKNSTKNIFNDLFVRNTKEKSNGTTSYWKIQRENWSPDACVNRTRSKTSWFDGNGLNFIHSIQIQRKRI